MAVGWWWTGWVLVCGTLEGSGRRKGLRRTDIAILVCVFFLATPVVVQKADGWQLRPGRDVSTLNHG